jgi:hypothetical protein
MMMKNRKYLKHFGIKIKENPSVRFLKKTIPRSSRAESRGYSPAAGRDIPASPGDIL